MSPSRLYRISISFLSSPALTALSPTTVQYVTGSNRCPPSTVSICRVGMIASPIEIEEALFAFN